MSNGVPADLAGVGERKHVVYAEGCDPQHDPDFYDTSRDLVGGDDFVEFVAFGEHNNFAELMTNFEELVFDVSPDNFTVLFQKPRPRPSVRTRQPENAG